MITDVFLARQVVGEQQLKSWLIDPVQRLPRYSLYIDSVFTLSIKLFMEFC